MLYQNQNLLKYKGRSEKYFAVVKHIDNKFIVLRSIQPRYDAKVFLKEQEFNIGKQLVQYIELYQIKTGDLVEFHASVFCRKTNNSIIYGLNRLRQIESFNVIYV